MNSCLRSLPVRLTHLQIETYHRDGFITLDGLFSASEVAAMRAELERIQEIETDHLVREKGSNVAKTISRRICFPSSSCTSITRNAI